MRLHLGQLSLALFGTSAIFSLGDSSWWCSLCACLPEATHDSRQGWSMSAQMRSRGVVDASERTPATSPKLQV